MGAVAKLVSIAYPLGDILLLAAAIRLAVDSGRREPAFYLIASSILALLVTDFAYGLVTLRGAYDGQVILDVGWISFYLLWGAAALHPSVREIGRQATTPERGLSRPLLIVLTAASLIAPGLLAWELMRGRVVDGLAIVLGSIALFLLVITRMAQLLREIDTQAQQLRQLARVDELTGLPNRRSWSSELPQAIERARRDRSPLVVAMLDLDYFKRFNDEFGHPAGDRLLKGAAAAWTAELRGVDQLARYGGEEFIVLFPGATGAEAVEILARLRAATPAGQSFSAGAAVWNGADTSDELVARADQALYQAKAAGRRQTVVAADAPVTAHPVG